jgi:hypothetical protein
MNMIFGGVSLLFLYANAAFVPKAALNSQPGAGGGALLPKTR